jgi:hypothetical protein
LEFGGIGGIIGRPISRSRGVKPARPIVANPGLALALAILTGLLGSVLSFLAWARIVMAIMPGLKGIGIAAWGGFPVAFVFAVLSFVLIWKKLNA